MHRLLKRQVKQVFGKNFDTESLDDKTLKLLAHITETYENFDKEKQFLNDTIKKNKRELKEAYSSMLVSSRLAGIGEMLENITHQWKQPLSIILNLTSLLKIELKEHKELDIIEEQTQYLDRTIRDFNNFSSHSTEEKKFFSLNKSIAETIKIFNFQAESNQIKIVTQLEKDLILKGNIGKFNQALMVILSNAKDAFQNKNMKDKYVFIKGEHNEKSITVTIQDNAGGIEASVIDKIFEPYFTTKFKDKGTGIGLSMTFNIIKKMRGTISAKNHNEGALFTITLPKYLKQKDFNE